MPGAGVAHTCHGVCQPLHGGCAALRSLHSACKVGHEGGLARLAHFHPQAAVAVHGACRHLSACTLQPVPAAQMHAPPVCWALLSAVCGLAGRQQRQDASGLCHCSAAGHGVFRGWRAPCQVQLQAHRDGPGQQAGSAPGSLVTGMASPESALSSTLLRPEATTPSTGTGSPGSTMTWSPADSASAGTSRHRLPEPTCSRAVAGTSACVQGSVQRRGPGASLDRRRAA